MNAAQAMTRLNPQAHRWTMYDGGKPEFTTSDIAAGLGFIKHDGARFLGRVKYAEQYDYHDVLLSKLRLDMYRHARRNQWKQKTRDMTPICQAAIREILAPRLCRKCNGQGSKRVNNLLIVCPKCEGHGVLGQSERLRSGWSNMGRWYFHRHWAKEYKEVLCRLDLYEEIFWRAMNRQLRS